MVYIQRWCAGGLVIRNSVEVDRAAVVRAPAAAGCLLHSTFELGFPVRTLCVAACRTGGGVEAGTPHEIRSCSSHQGFGATSFGL